MSQNPAVVMGHFRFGVINPLLSADDPRSLKERFAELAARVWTLPNGSLRHYSAATIEDWYYDYRTHGLPALINPPRRDTGTHRVVSVELSEAIESLLADHPTIKSSNLIRLLDQRGLRVEGRPSDSTIYRYLRRLRQSQQRPVQERRAFEAPYAGCLYQTDIMYGPHLRVKTDAGRYRMQQSYLLAILDDHSRMLCHGEFFLTQDLMIYVQVLEQAIRKRGIPDRIYCDNGKVFLSDQIKRIGAEIGTRVVHTAVRDAAAKGKIERFFLTVRQQFLDLDWRTETTHSLEVINQRFAAWCEAYNNRRHSAIDCTPLEKWLASPRRPRLLQDQLDADQLFLLETTRRVKKDGTFSLLGRRYETLGTAAGGTITVRYHRHQPSRVHVYFHDQYLGFAHLLDTQANHLLPRQKQEPSQP